MKKSSTSRRRTSAEAPISTFATGSSYAPVHHLPTHHRHPHLRLEEVCRWRGEEVAVDDGQVGELAGLDGAARALLERGEGGVEGEAADRFGEREFLRRVP